MKDTITYKLTSGKNLTVEYDTESPCKVCDLSVTSASMGGTDLCPWCDNGTYRNGERWDTMNVDKIKRRARQIQGSKSMKNDQKNLK